MIKKWVIALTLLLLLTPSLQAQPNTVISFEEEDGSPSVYFPWKVKVPNASLTDNGDGTVSINIWASSSSITDTQVVYSNSGVLSGDAGMTYNAGTDTLTLTGTGIFGELNLHDDEYLYFDTAKTNYFRYNSAHGRIEIGGTPPGFQSIGRLDFCANAEVDGLGTWEPSIYFATTGETYLVNTLQGAEGRKFFEIRMPDGVRFDTNTGSGYDAVLKADNMAASDKTFQFPNESGTLLVADGTQNITTTGMGRFVGSDFMTDGGFDDDGAWSIGDNWSVTGSQGVYSGGAVAPTYLQPDPALTIISGRDYVASINIVSWSGTSPPTMWVGGDQNTLSTGTGVQYSYFTTVNTTNARLRAANQELTVDDFTLRLLPENPSEVGDLKVWRDLIVANTLNAGAATVTSLDAGSGTITTEGRIIATGGGQTGAFQTGLAGVTVLAFDGANFDIRAGAGGSASQNVMRVDNSGNFNFYDGTLTTSGTLKGTSIYTDTIYSIAETQVFDFSSADSGWANMYVDLEMNDNSISEVINLTATGTITGEQLTSTDDITMAGFFLNTLTATDTGAFRVNGTTNPYSGDNSFTLFDLARGFAGQTLWGGQDFKGFKTTLSVNFDVEGLDEGQITSTVMENTSSFIVDINAGDYADWALKTTGLKNTISMLPRFNVSDVANEITLTGLEGIASYQGLYFARNASPITVYGARINAVSSPTEVTGFADQMVLNLYGAHISASANGKGGTERLYSIYIASAGGAVTENWAYYNSTAADNFMGTDGSVSMWGTTNTDLQISSDGTNGVINTNAALLINSTTVDITSTTDPQLRLTHTDGVDEVDHFVDADGNYQIDATGFEYYIGDAGDDGGNTLTIFDGGVDNQPAAMCLSTDDGTPYYFWVDTSGNFRGHSAHPSTGDDDTLGVIIADLTP